MDRDEVIGVWICNCGHEVKDNAKGYKEVDEERFRWAIGFYDDEDPF